MNSLLITLGSVFAGGLISLSGVVLNDRLTNRREREKRRTDFIERQLSEFYGPLMSLSKQVAARRKHRENIEAAINENWEQTAPALRNMGFDNQHVAQMLASQLDTLTEDDQRHLKEELLPDFREMLHLFRERMWLAEPTTRPYFDIFLEYVDTWELSLRGVIKGRVALELRPGENKLAAFYSDLEATHDRLRRNLTNVQNRCRGILRRWSKVRSNG